MTIRLLQSNTDGTMGESLDMGVTWTQRPDFPAGDSSYKHTIQDGQGNIVLWTPSSTMHCLYSNDAGATFSPITELPLALTYMQYLNGMFIVRDRATNTIWYSTTGAPGTWTNSHSVLNGTNYYYDQDILKAGGQYWVNYDYNYGVFTCPDFKPAGIWTKNRNNFYGGSESQYMWIRYRALTSRADNNSAVVYDNIGRRFILFKADGTQQLPSSWQSWAMANDTSIAYYKGKYYFPCGDGSRVVIWCYDESTGDINTVHEVVVDTHNPNPSQYAMTGIQPVYYDDSLIVWGVAYTYRSTDGGVTWQSIPNWANYGNASSNMGAGTFAFGFLGDKPLDEAQAGTWKDVTSDVFWKGVPNSAHNAPVWDATNRRWQLLDRFGDTSYTQFGGRLQPVSSWASGTEVLKFRVTATKDKTVSGQWEVLTSMLESDGVTSVASDHITNVVGAVTGGELDLQKKSQLGLFGSLDILADDALNTQNSPMVVAPLYITKIEVFITAVSDASNPSSPSTPSNYLPVDPYVPPPAQIAAGQNRYPFSTANGDSIPLDIVRPLTMLTRNFTNTEGTPVIEFPATSDVFSMLATANCILVFGKEAELPVDGTIIPNAIFVPKDRMITFQALDKKFSVIGLTQSGTVYFTALTKWSGLALDMQLRRQ